MRPLAISQMPRPGVGNQTAYENLPRALPVFAVAVDGAQIDHFDDESWGYRFDPDSEVLHCQPLSEGECVRNSKVVATSDKRELAHVLSPDGEIRYCLGRDLQLEITDLVQGKTWQSKLPELRVQPDAKLRLSISSAGDQLFIHASSAFYLNRAQSKPTLFVFDTNRTPRKNLWQNSNAKPLKAHKRKKKGVLEKLFDKIIEKMI